MRAEHESTSRRPGVYMQQGQCPSQMSGPLSPCLCKYIVCQKVAGRVHFVGT